MKNKQPILKKEESNFRKTKQKLSWASFNEKYENVSISLTGKCSNGFEKIKSFYESSSFNLIICFFGILAFSVMCPESAFALKHAQIKAAYDSAHADDLKEDIVHILEIFAGVAGLGTSFFIKNLKPLLIAGGGVLAYEGYSAFVGSGYAFCI